MPLPTTNLTLHFDASDTDRIFTTWGNSDAHTGTPADGNTVQAWMRETDGSVSPITAGYRDAGPEYRSSTPLMLLPCLDFDGGDAMRVTNGDTLNTDVNISSFFGAQAKTLIIAVYPEAITSTSATIVDNHGVFTFDANGLHFKDDGGTKKAIWAINDGSIKSVEKTIGTGATYVLCARHDTSNIYLSVDGGAESSTACGSGGGSSSSVTIGRSDGGIRLNARIGEIALYNTADSSQAATAIAYFRQKWQGISSGGGNASTRRVLLGIG